MTRIPIKYGSPWKWLLPLLLLPERFAYIQIDGGLVQVRLGWGFRLTFSRSDIMEIVDHGPVLSIGAHGWKGRWLVNGAHRPIAVIRLTHPSSGRVVGFPVRVRELLVSVDDREALRRALLR
jgi:hypothetical protein